MRLPIPRPAAAVAAGLAVVLVQACSATPGPATTSVFDGGVTADATVAETATPKDAGADTADGQTSETAVDDTLADAAVDSATDAAVDTEPEIGRAHV